MVSPSQQIGLTDSIIAVKVRRLKTFNSHPFLDENVKTKTSKNGNKTYLVFLWYGIYNRHTLKLTELSA